MTVEQALTVGQETVQAKCAANPYPSKADAEVKIGWLDSRQLTALYQGVKFVLAELRKDNPNSMVMFNSLNQQAVILSDIDRQSECARREMAERVDEAAKVTDSKLGLVEEFIRRLPQELDATLTLSTRKPPPTAG